MSDPTFGILTLSPKNVSHGCVRIISFGGHGMSRTVRARYTLEYKQEAVRLVRGRQPNRAVARGLGISDQTVHNCVKTEAEGRLAATSIKPFTAEQAEIARLKAELARAW